MLFTTPRNSSQRNPYFSSLILSIGLSLFVDFESEAQVIPDNSLGNENSIVTPNITLKDALADLIEGGAIRGDNLFHSFEQFSINDGGRVYFANPDGVTNILTRVTGSNISEIFGTVGVDGAANLFLLNPNGIVFGENTALDVAGSFLATTADSYIFENGFEYSATNPDTPPLLTINIPLGLQMGTNSGNITVNGNGHQLGFNSIFEPIVRDTTSPRLQVPTQQNIALIGNNIYLDGGILVAEGGMIELGSVTSGKVGLIAGVDGWNFDYSDALSLGKINLTNAALLDASGEGGLINLYGSEIIFLNSSFALLQAKAQQEAGNFNLYASESFKLSGSLPNAVLSSVVISETLEEANAGDINITTQHFVSELGASVINRNLGKGNGGDINLNASESINMGKPPIYGNLSSTINSFTVSTGNAGNVNVNTRQLILNNSGVIGALTFASGDGGTVNINASELIRLNETQTHSLGSSSITSSTSGLGNAGNLNIKTQKLEILNGSEIATSSLGSGNAGSIIINASESLEIKGSKPGGQDIVSLISSEVNNPSPLFLQVLNLPETFLAFSNSGDIKIDTSQLRISQRGNISVSNRGTGNAGVIQINGDLITLDSQGKLEAFTNSGQGGNMTLNINELLILKNQSQITVESIGLANGGNININNTDNIVLLKNSQIIANAIQGNGGNINITTQGLFVAPDSKISASSQFGLDGNVAIESINGDRPIELNPLSIEPIDATQQITKGCGSESDFTISGKGGLPENPTQNLRNNTVWQDLRLLVFEDSPVIIQPLSLRSYFSSSKIIEATNWKINQQGNIELVANNSDTNTLNWQHDCSQNTIN